jgi:hypothetical protein
MPHAKFCDGYVLVDLFNNIPLEADVRLEL